MKKHLPNQHDALFKNESSLEYGVWLQSPANKFFLYSEGYKEAGNKLYEYCVENAFYGNLMIYPLIFTYRHFVEIRLKELIIMGYRYLDEAKDFHDEHSLMKLWNVYRKEIIEKITDDIPKEDLDNVQRIIAQFADEDPDSMSFRYPVSKAPNRTPLLKRETIDLENFKKVMDKLIFFFDWQWDMLSNMLDIKAEMIADMYSEYWG